MKSRVSKLSIMLNVTTVTTTTDGDHCVTHDIE